MSKLWFSMKSALALTAFTAVAVTLIAILHQVTRPFVTENKRSLALQRLEVLMQGYDINSLRFNPDILADKEQSLCDTQQRLVVRLQPLTARGYGGPIKLILASDSEGRITGVSVLEHRETPGLGDLIDRQRSRWIEQFQGLSREAFSIDTVTGATITTRAVINAVRENMKQPQTPSDCAGANDA